MANEGINFSTLVYLPVMDTFSVDVLFYSGGGWLYNRGVFDTRTLNVLAEDNSIYSDQQTILDIRESEFTTLPVQGDLVTIPADCNGVNQGTWEIINTWTNGGGEMTLQLRKWEGAVPP